MEKGLKTNGYIQNASVKYLVSHFKAEDIYYTTDYNNLIDL